MSAAKEGYGDVFAVCPKLVPLNLQQTIWQGFIRVHVSIIPRNISYASGTFFKQNVCHL